MKPTHLHRMEGGSDPEGPSRRHWRCAVMKARDRVHKGVPGDYQRDLEGSVRLPAGASGHVEWSLFWNGAAGSKL